MSIVDNIRQALASFSSELTKLRREIETLQQQRESLIGAPAAKADIVAVLHAWCDAQRAPFMSAFAQRLASDVTRPGLDLVDADRIQRHSTNAFYGIVSSANGTATAKSVDTALAGLLGGLLKSALATAIDEMPWPDSPGLPMLERRRRVAAIDAKLDTLKSQERDLVQAAAQSRISVD